MHPDTKTKLDVLGVDQTFNRGNCAAVADATVSSMADVESATGQSVRVGFDRAYHPRDAGFALCPLGRPTPREKHR